MRQTTKLSRVEARIKALAEKTVSNGSTEAEAMAAAEMVGRLLERYALSMAEIDVREQRCIQVEVPIGASGGVRSMASHRASALLRQLTAPVSLRTDFNRNRFAIHEPHVSRGHSGNKFNDQIVENKSASRATPCID